MSDAAAPPAVRVRKPIKTETLLGFALLGLAAGAVIASFFAGPKSFTQIMVIGISNGAVFALIALGYTMVYGIIELINFAHGDLFMLGAVFSSIFLEEWLNQTRSGLTGWALLGLTLVVAMIFCACLNMLIEFLAYRRLRNAPKLAPLITAVGVSFILQNLGIVFNGSAPKSRKSVLPQGGIMIGSIEIKIKYMIVLVVTIPLLLLMTYIVQKTKTGKAMRATAQDRDASLLMGINVDRIIAITFALGGALAGAAGTLFAQVNGRTSYDLGFRLGLIAFTAAVLGGVGNLPGAVLGGFLIGLIQAFNDGAPRFRVPGLPFRFDVPFGQEWTQTVLFGILIIMIIFRPGGIFGKVQQEKV